MALLVLEEAVIDKDHTLSVKAREVYEAPWIYIHSIFSHRLLHNKVLDLITFMYALGCSRMRRSDPFRRQTVRAADTSLYSHPLTSLMLIWTYDHLHYNADASHLSLTTSRGFSSFEAEEKAWLKAMNITNKSYGAYGACFRYHPPLETCLLAWSKPAVNARYFVTMSHGSLGCAEFYYVTEG